MNKDVNETEEWCDYKKYKEIKELLYKVSLRLFDNDFNYLYCSEDDFNFYMDFIKKSLEYCRLEFKNKLEKNKLHETKEK